MARISRNDPSPSSPGAGLQARGGQSGSEPSCRRRATKPGAKSFGLLQVSARRVEEELKERQRENAARLSRFQGEVRRRVMRRGGMRRLQQLRPPDDAVSAALPPPSSRGAAASPALRREKLRRNQCESGGKK